MLQHIFNELIKQDIKPFLATFGFNKKGLNFYKRTDNLIYLIHFQKSAGNTATQVLFYVNCGIYAAELAQIQSKEILTSPKEVECHFRARMREIADTAPDRFSITATTNIDNVRKMLLPCLEDVHHFFETMTSARSIVDYYTSGPFLHLGEESFHLLLQANDVTAAKHYFNALRKKHGAEQRWSIFEQQYHAIFNQYGVKLEII
ncbi:DUF4304 domain-containing protein [Lysinibacillus irui]|uniref:DUF4304 domain-containing protein n=1 Tax=Lysinibacillus irui TaxID=2998077 RepID=UPI0038861636